MARPLLKAAERKQLLAQRLRPMRLDPGCWPGIDAAVEAIARVVRGDELVYGINTEFGSLTRRRISATEVNELQHRLVRSHAAGLSIKINGTVEPVALIARVL